MIFVVALYLPWCSCLGAQDGVEPQLYADSLKCVSRDPAAFLRAARSAPRKCVLEYVSGCQE